MSHSRRQPTVRRAGGAVRTLLLITLSMALVGGAFVLYQFTQGGSPSATPNEPIQGQAIERHDAFLANPFGDEPTEVLGGRVPIRSGESARFEILDDQLRKKLVVEFDHREPEDETGELWTLTRPVIKFFMPKGEKATLKATEGRIRVRATGNMEPISGQLIGNVQVVVDRTTDRWRMAHPESVGLPTPQSELVRMWMDEIDFDRQRGVLRGLGAIRIESEEMRLDGRGLEVRWSDVNNRIESLRIEEGQRLTFESAFAMGLDLLEEDEDRDTLVGPPAPTAEQRARAAGSTGEQLARIEAYRQRPDVLVIDLSHRQDEPRTINTYLATFDSDVVARQEGGQQGVMKADVLEILLDMPTGFGRKRDDTSEASDPDGGAIAELDPDMAGPPEPVVDKARHKVNVSWRGPLVIRAMVDGPGLEGALRRQIVARGTPVVVENAEGRATAAELVRHVHSGFTELTGTPEHPVVLTGQNDMRLRAGDVVTVDLRKRLIDLDGEVDIHLDGSDVRARHIIARFGEAAPQQHHRGLRDLIRQLECQDRVHLVQDGGDLRCGNLILDLTPDAVGRNIPQRARATTDVTLLQGARRVQAQRVDVTFGDIPETLPGEPVAAWPAIRELHAEERVVVLDPQRGWDIVGSKLRCTFDDDQVITYGQVIGEDGADAHVQLDQYYAQGASITFDDALNWAHIPGPGIARFAVAQDLDGRQVDRPVPVEVSWTRQMLMQGADDQLVFEGAAVARSADNTLRGDVIELRLTDVVPEPEPAPEQIGQRDPLGLWMLRPVAEDIRPLQRLIGLERDKPRYARARLRQRATRVIARSGVDKAGQRVPAVLESRTVDGASDQLASRLTMESREIAFDLESQVLAVDGGGVMGIEDYPTASAVIRRQQQPNGGLFGDARADGPSQTVVTWDARMSYHYAERVAEFHSRQQPVTLQHLAGAHVREVPGLDAERLQAVRANERGRSANLSTERLLVQFAPEDGPARGGGQMSFGQLDQFEANNSVILNDSKDGWYVTGDRLMYNASRQLLEVHGRASADAYISRIDPADGRGWEWKCAKLFLELQEERVSGPDCHGQSVGR